MLISVHLLQGRVRRVGVLALLLRVPLLHPNQEGMQIVLPVVVVGEGSLSA